MGIVPLSLKRVGEEGREGEGFRGRRDSPPHRSHNEPHRRSQTRHLESNPLPCRACFEGFRSSSVGRTTKHANKEVSVSNRRTLDSLFPSSPFAPPSPAWLRVWADTYDQTTPLGIDLHISRQDSDRARIEGLLEVSELLVRESFDRGGVDSPATTRGNQIDRTNSAFGLETPSCRGRERKREREKRNELDRRRERVGRRERDVPRHMLSSQSDSVLCYDSLSGGGMSCDEDGVAHLCRHERKRRRRVSSGFLFLALGHPQRNKKWRNHSPRW